MSPSPRPPRARFRIERLEQRIAPAIIASELLNRPPAPGPAQPADSPPPPAASAPPPPTPPVTAAPPPAGPPPTPAFTPPCACPPAGLTASLNLGATLPTGGCGVCRC